MQVVVPCHVIVQTDMRGLDSCRFIREETVLCECFELRVALRMELACGGISLNLGSAKGKRDLEERCDRRPCRI